LGIQILENFKIIASKNKVLRSIQCVLQTQVNDKKTQQQLTVVDFLVISQR